VSTVGGPFPPITSTFPWYYSYPVLLVLSKAVVAWTEAGTITWTCLRSIQQKMQLQKHHSQRPYPPTPSTKEVIAESPRVGRPVFCHACHHRRPPSIQPETSAPMPQPPAHLRTYNVNFAEDAGVAVTLYLGVSAPSTVLRTDYLEVGAGTPYFPTAIGGGCIPLRCGKYLRQ
jgi:hypothetical protein